ncbi:MAG: Gfo/Idh/MocA family oxidoreductase [Pirellulales bacterium]|nr:Gfo/Idh/MocA family oxidoreductase [Pirellulales bacterium]
MTKHFSRRQFLEDSMWAATSALALAAVPAARSFADDASKSPSEKLGVAIVGVRGRGREHIENFATRPDTEILYICDADEKVGNSLCKDAERRQGRAPKYVRDMREAFEDKAVDIVSTATPNHWHALCSIWAMQAGKDVYVEKPVSHNVSEGRRMVEAARKYNKICQTGTQIRSTEGTKKAMAFLHAGKLGDVKLARGLCYKRRGSIGPRQEHKPPASVDYSLWCGPAPMDPLTRRNLHYDWHWVYSTGNGDLGNQGIHQMDVGRWGLGLDGLAKRVVSYGGRLGYEDAGDTANTQVSILDYGDRKLVFEVRGLKTEPLKGADVGNIFYGSDGYLVMTGYSSGAAFDRDGKMIEKFEGGGDHFGNFIQCVRSRKVEDLSADIEQGHQSSALCHLSNISYLLGEKLGQEEVKSRLGNDEENQETFARVAAHLKENGVDLADTKLQFGADLAFNPATETFVDHPQADKLLTREYRAPFVVPAAGKV